MASRGTTKYPPKAPVEPAPTTSKDTRPESAAKSQNIPSKPSQNTRTTIPAKPPSPVMRPTVLPQAQSKPPDVLHPPRYATQHTLHGKPVYANPQSFAHPPSYTDLQAYLSPSTNNPRMACAQPSAHHGQHVSGNPLAFTGQLPSTHQLPYVPPHANLPPPAYKQAQENPQPPAYSQSPSYGSIPTNAIHDGQPKQRAGPTPKESLKLSHHLPKLQEVLGDLKNLATADLLAVRDEIAQRMPTIQRVLDQVERLPLLDVLAVQAEIARNLPDRVTEHVVGRVHDRVSFMTRTLGTNDARKDFGPHRHARR